MPKLPRVTVVLFGNTGPGTDFGQYGSKTAAAPQTEADFGSLSAFIAGCQSLSAWVTGWTAAAVGAAFNPYLEDMNGAFKVFSYYLFSLFERGIPDWDAGTTYYKGSYVNDPAGSGQRWYSLTDNNLNNAPPVGASNAQWQWDNPPLPSTFGFGNAITAALNIFPNTGAPTTKVDVEADIISVQGVSLTALAATLNFSAAGPVLNGRDQAGAFAANTWVAILAVTDDFGTPAFTGLLASLSDTAPTLPSGVTKFRRIGWAYIDGTGAITQFQMQGDWWTWTDANQFILINPVGTTNMRNYGMSPTSKLASFKMFESLSTITWKVTGSGAPALEILSSAGGQIVTASAQLASNDSQQMDLVSGQGRLTTMSYYDPA